MSGNRSKPDLTLVNLIHQSLRADAARLVAAVTALDPSGRPGRLPGIRAFFDQYRAQLATHHTHEDELFFPALEARVGAGKMQLTALAGQHEALDAALAAACDGLAALADPAGNFTADRARAAGALSAMAELLAAHLTLEEQTALPLTESEMPAAEYRELETKARKATPRPQAQFMIPWVIAHATSDQRKALYRSAPPLRLLNWLNRRRYLRLDQALTHTATALREQTQTARPLTGWPLQQLSRPVFCSNICAARSRSFSRRARPSAESPPPSGSSGVP